MESRIGHLHDGVILLLRPEHLMVESGIMGYGIRNTVQGMLNASDDWNLESKGQLRNYWNPESKAWNPDSKTVSDSLQIHGVKRASATASKLAHTCTPAVDETSDENDVR